MCDRKPGQALSSSRMKWMRAGGQHGLYCRGCTCDLVGSSSTGSAEPAHMQAQ